MKLLIQTILLLFLLPVFLMAQAVKMVTLEDCVDYAIQNNHTHKQSILNREKAIEQENEAFGLSVLPQIKGTANYTNAIERSMFKIEAPGFSGSFPMGSRHTFTAGISVEQPLFSGAMFLATRIARTYAAVTEKASEYSEEDLILQVREAYYTYLLAESFVKLADHQINRAEENKKNTQSLFEAGLVPEYDLIRANVAYQNLIPEKTNAINQQLQAMNNLKLVMGSDLDVKLVIKDSLVFESIKAIDYNAGLDSLHEKNSLIKQMELQTELQMLNAKYEWTKHLPELQAFGNWQTQALEEAFKPADWQFFNSTNVGISLKFPIFSGFSTSSKVQQAEIDSKISEENYILTKETVKNNYENVLLQINKSREQVDAYLISMAEAERGYQISLKRFDSGLGTQLEITDALGSLLLTEVNYLQSVFDYYLNNARLDLILGKKRSEIVLN